MAAFRARYVNVYARDRPLTYDIAVDEEYAGWRIWMDEQVAQLSPGKARLVTSRIWQEMHHWPCIFELATGASLRAAGYRVEYDMPVEGKTPDWMILSPEGIPTCIVEVHTDQPHPSAYGQVRAWRDLAARLEEIAVPVVLFIGQAPSRRPPDRKTARQIAKDVSDSLLSQPISTRIDSHGYAILVAADSRAGGLLRSRHADHAEFDSPTPISGQVSAKALSERISGKVKKYRGLADKYDVPLVVAVGAHKFTGVDLAAFDRILEGDATFSLQFNRGDFDLGPTMEIDLANPPRWDMPPELSGVLWISNEFPFTATARPNAAAIRPMPAPIRCLGC